MPRKTRRPTPPPARPPRTPWGGYALTAVLAALFGSGITYLALRPALHPPRPAASVPNPAAASAALAAGNAAFDHKDWPTAIADYNAAIAEGLDNPDIRTDLGSAYRFAGQPQKALDEYTIAQRENPAHENSLFNQGGVYLVMGNPTRAIAVWQQYLQRFPHGQHVADAHTLIAASQAHALASTPKP